MALDNSKKGFGFDVEARFSKVSKPDPASGTEYTHEHTHTHEHDYNDETTQKTIKSKRIQILTYDSLVLRMDNYAKRKGLSRAELFELAVSDYLDQHE